MAHSAIAVLVVAAAVSVASCGERSDRQRIAEAIATKFASDDVGACTAHATVRFLEQLEGVRGRAAVEVCERNAGAPGRVAESVDVTHLRVGDGQATARVAIHGSRLDGQTPTLRLVEQGGEWRVDGIVGLRLRGRLLQPFERRFRRQVLARSRLSRAQADCILERIEGDLSAAELTDLLVGELPADLRSRIKAATRRCVPGR